MRPRWRKKDRSWKLIISLNYRDGCVRTYKDKDTISVVFPGVADTCIVFLCFFHVSRPHFIHRIFTGCGRSCCKWCTVSVPLRTFVARRDSLGSLYQFLEVRIRLRHSGFAKQVNAREGREGRGSGAYFDVCCWYYLYPLSRSIVTNGLI